ncbi:MAG: hypothetical protein J6P58_01340, partial [Oscillospiraceae bacterium]|nr:hypothetical protein [Oscillospiraceae bacterium]
RNGKIYDGTGADARFGDVLIEDDRVLAVGENLSCDDAAVVELNGLSISSGFMDAHSHNDWFAIKKEPEKYFEPFIRQGITSFIAGNCGLSAIGFDDDIRDVETVGGGLFAYRDTTGVYPDAERFFAAVDGNMPCNLATLVGHCSARAGVAGNEMRPLTEAETERMLANMERSLQQGACGTSLGLMYEPGRYAGTEELKLVARLTEKYDLPMTVHPRAESKVSMDYPLLGRAHILRAIDELEEISRGTKMKLQHSHLIFVGRQSFACKDEAIRILRRMRENGVDAQYDIYCETLGVSVITVVMPAWYQAMSAADKRKPLNKLRFAALVKITTMLLGFGWDDIQIAYVGEGNEKYEGKTVAQIAKEMGKSPVDAYLDLCEMSDFRGRVNMGPYTTEEIISEFSKDDICLFMTDAWVEEHGVQNPAIYDCFPKFLRNSLLGTGDTMPRTIRKMTGGVADRFSIPERGYLKPGYYADLTIFNEEKLRSGIPDQGRSFGIEKVYINGKLALDGDELQHETLKTSGRAMRAVTGTKA